VNVFYDKDYLYKATLAESFGAYYFLNKKFVFFRELNPFRVNFTLDNNLKNTSNGNFEDNKFGFDLTGALTPNFKLGDISFGLK
jgi:hypothetical protein